MLFNFNIFGNTLTRRVEKKKKIEGEIEVLKKEQKVHFERAIKNANARKETLNNEIENSILLYQTKIKELQSQKERQNFLNDEELKLVHFIDNALLYNEFIHYANKELPIDKVDLISKPVFKFTDFKEVENKYKELFYNLINNI